MRTAAKLSEASYRPTPPHLVSDTGHKSQGLDADRGVSRESTKFCYDYRTEFRFGPFRLFPARFLLLEGDNSVPLGSRALEILTVLLERPGDVVSKQELMARIWPNVFVEPANLTVHISALRRVLHDGQGQNRFIINIPGRGYSFVARVVLADSVALGGWEAAPLHRERYNLSAIA